VPGEVVVLHHDEHLVAVDKPHFLPVTPGGRHLQETVLVRLKRQLGIETLVPMHRLDLETAGVLLFMVQPIIAKQILPWFGGSSAVWTTALVFFQSMTALPEKIRPSESG
jgi:23S rRNA-/tRNA-specific pseudouridylate synthase